MKNGYYLSVYAHISSLTHLMNICLRDNQNMALWRKEGDQVSLVHYWEFERVSGKKQHGLSFFDIRCARNAINGLLNRYNLILDDMQQVIGTPGLDTTDDYSTVDTMPEYPYHSLMHFYSSVLMDTEKFNSSDIIALSVDGGPDNVVDIKGRSKPFYVGAVCRKGKTEFFPIESPGMLWVFMKYRYRMQEGSLMALGSASNSTANINLEECVVRLKPIMGMNDITPTYEWFDEIAKSIENISVENPYEMCNGFDERFSEQENKISMLVKIMQKVSIIIMERNVKKLLDASGLDPANTLLALSGGYSLNCPTNSHLLQTFGFKGMMAPPCVSDTGISLGMGLYYFHKNGAFKFLFKDAFYGDDDNNLSAVIESEEFRSFVKSVTPFDVDRVVEDIRTQPILWFNGRAEIGPRALGNRSIFADPSKPEHKERVNEIKQRQWWRPVAPIILEEQVKEWFEHACTSPYMLNTLTMVEEKRKYAPAVLHMDNTARVQTIDEHDTTIMKIVLGFYEKTDIPMICNTSLNDKGEPIIDSIAEALNYALRKRMQVAYVNGWRLELVNHEQYLPDEPRKRSEAFTYLLSDESREEWLSKLNPFSLSKGQLVLYFNNPEIYELTLTEEKDVKILKRMFRHMQTLPG